MGDIMSISTVYYVFVENTNETIVLHFVNTYRLPRLFYGCEVSPFSCNAQVHWK